MKFLWVLLVVSILLAAQEATAKRLGGMASVGKQLSFVPQQRSATPTALSSVKNGSASVQNSATGSAVAAAHKKPWLSMLGGLAAGLGLAWLASSLGEGVGQFFMLTLLALGLFGVVVMVMRYRAVGRSASTGLVDSGAGLGITMPRNYSSNNVGNDASARPWERATPNFESSRYPDVVSPEHGSGNMTGALVSRVASWVMPEDFDVDGFLATTKNNFVNLQAAWDKADIPSLRVMMTHGMLEEIKAQLAEREQQLGGNSNITEVVMIEAHILGIEETDGHYMASVEFSGLIREALSSGPNPFREVWSFARLKSDPSRWLVAGVQALQ